MENISGRISDVDLGDAAAWGSALIALLALVATAVIARAQRKLGEKQYQLGVAQQNLTARTAATEQSLAIAHAGAQTAMAWRDQVLLLHDRGLSPGEIRWIMCCEDYGIGHEEGNGIIDEVIDNVPRVPPPGMTDAPNRDPRRSLPRPGGAMRADRGQTYGFETEHPHSGS